MERIIYVGNGGVFGFADGLFEIFEREINKIMGDDENTFQNKVQAIINHMNDTVLKELLQGYTKTEKKTIKDAYVIARKKLLKQEIKNDLEQIISQSLEQGSNLEELILKMQSDAELIKMYGEMSDEDKKYIIGCMGKTLKNMQKKVNDNNQVNIEEEKEEIILTAMKEVEPETLKTALNANEETIKPEQSEYLEEVAEFTNDYKFLCEDSSVYAAKTGYRRKFHNFENYEKFYKLRSKLKEIVNTLEISECEVIRLILEGSIGETNRYTSSLDKKTSEKVKLLVEKFSESVQEDKDNKYILEQVRSQMLVKSNEDKKTTSGEGR